MKGKGVQHIFSKVPETYEWVNHVLTCGLDIIWRKQAVRLATKGGGRRWIDLCTGTGETASYLCRKAKNKPSVYATDFSMPMLKKATEKSESRNIRFLISDIRRLPFSDNTFDLMTISFATRNINLSRDILLKTFEELHRVLNPGGLLVNLETSQPSSVWIRTAFHGFVKRFVIPLGSRISGSQAGYTYLARTIPRFYPAETLAHIMQQAGFKDVRFKKRMFGVVATHQGSKQNRSIRSD
jgi:demethylmenaquinone methyltransferase/2-methoxy-6-polyprenyl-1,4-benzoquinol methylase